MVIEIFLGVFVVTRISNIMAEYYADKTSRPGVNKRHLVFMLKKILQIAVYASAIIVIFYVFKVDLTGAIVGLDIGGIAIAFALQGTLSDFFSAFAIYTDRPFEIGDFITVDEYSAPSQTSAYDQLDSNSYQAKNSSCPKKNSQRPLCETLGNWREGALPSQ